MYSKIVVSHEAMMMTILLLGILCLFQGSSSVSLFPKQGGPEQVHISSTGKISEMVITWSAFVDVEPSFVQYGTGGNLTDKTRAYSTKFVDGGPKRHTQFIYRAMLNGLSPNTTYTYQCGSSSGRWSKQFSFTTYPAGTDWSPKLIIYGDFGLKNPQSLSRLKTEIGTGMYHAILHNGDFAYDMESEDAEVGDSFMRMIEPLSASVPYMTTPGNHEFAYNFSNYKNRFTMPMYNDTENLWYSWDIGPAHFIMLSTEVYFYLKYGLHQIQNQLNWLKNDLWEADQPKAREARPWIITLAHRPPYCSDYGKKQCKLLYADTVRGAFEDIFYDHGVDLSFWAHEHDYERMWPVYNNTVYNGSTEEPYTDPPAPVHIITGSAGCDEDHSTFGPAEPYDAFRSLDYGYTKIHIINTTHIELQQISDDQGGKVIDQFYLIKHRHTMRRRH